MTYLVSIVRSIMNCLPQFGYGYHGGDQIVGAVKMQPVRNTDLNRARPACRFAHWQHILSGRRSAAEATEERRPSFGRRHHPGIGGGFTRNPHPTPLSSFSRASLCTLGSILSRDRQQTREDDEATNLGRLRSSNCLTEQHGHSDSASPQRKPPRGRSMQLRGPTVQGR